MKNLALFLTHLLVCGICFAQNVGKLSGQIVDDKGHALPYATIKLSDLADESKTITTQSDIDGKYEFKRPQSGRYGFSVKRIGFVELKKEIILTDTTSTLTTIKMMADAKQLREVVVAGKKPFVEYQMDKTVLNVENSIVAAGSTALEVLEKAPGVIVDKQNDQIKMNNKTGVTFLIDGRTSFLSAADLTNMLSNMNSDQIATIELITNPSSKYDASGNAGIINIKLKKNKAFRTNGSVSLQGGNVIMAHLPANAYRTGLNLIMNHRNAKWNYFGNAAYAGKGNANIINVTRSTFYNGLSSNFNQNFERTNRGDGVQGKLGADYFINKKTVVGMMLDANYVNGSLANYSLSNVLESQSTSSTRNTAAQQTNATSPAGNLTLNLNLKHDFNDDGKTMSLDFDYAGFRNDNNEIFDANFYDNSGQRYDQTLLRNTTNRNINIFAMRSDLTFPVSKTFKIEAGIKSSYVITGNDFFAERSTGNVWQNDVGRSNNFNYRENINAAYTNLAKEWGSWGLQLGIRAEQTNATGELITTRSVFDRNYISLFPTAYLMKKINKDAGVRFGYSRRIDRPNYQQLNPFLFYMDPYAFEQGNPYLKPQFTNVYEANLNIKNYGLSINFSDSRDLITQLSRQNEETRSVGIIRINMGRTQNLAANLSAQVTFSKWWTSQNNVSIGYNRFSDNNIEGTVYSAGQFFYNINTNQNITISKTVMLEANYWVNSPRINGVEQTTIVQHALNLAIQKSMLNKKMRIKFGVDDVFLTNLWEGKIAYQNLNMMIKNRSSSRKALLAVNYNFGNQNVKSSRKRGTATDDIKSRTN